VLQFKTYGELDRFWRELVDQQHASKYGVVIQCDELSIACDQIANQCGLAALARTGNHDYRRVLESSSYEFGSEAREKHLIRILHFGQNLDLDSE